MTERNERSPIAGDEGIPVWAERVVLFLDDGFVVPGTTIRIGFDAVIGLVPGVGDMVTTAGSLSLVWLAEQRRLPRPVIARMLVNLGIDSLVGAIPLLGDLFDVAFKANRRNLELLQRYDAAPKQAARQDAMFFALVILGVIAMLTVPITIAFLIVRLILD